MGVRGVSAAPPRDPLRRAELELAASQSALDVLVQSGPSRRFPEAEHLKAIARARTMVQQARWRYLRAGL